MGSDSVSAHGRVSTAAHGRLAPSELQRYATLGIDDVLYHITEPQQSAHPGAATFDRAQGLLYVMEPLVDDNKTLLTVRKAPI